MDQGTRESFIATYKGLLDQLNEKKKAGIKFDFGHELKMYERDHELDTISYFRVRSQHCSQLSNLALISAHQSSELGRRAWALSQFQAMQLCSCSSRAVLRFHLFVSFV